MNETLRQRWPWGTEGPQELIQITNLPFLIKGKEDDFPEEIKWFWNHEQTEVEDIMQPNMYEHSLKFVAWGKTEQLSSWAEKVRSNTYLTHKSSIKYMDWGNSGNGKESTG